MKNVCIVLRNTKNSVTELDFSLVTDAFLSGGFFLDEVLLLPYEEVGTLHAKISVCLRQADMLCVVADKVLVDGVKNSITQAFSLSFQKNTAIAEKTLVCVLPMGEEGKQTVFREIIPLLNERLHIQYDRMIFRMVGVPQEKLEDVVNRAYAVSGDALHYNYTESFSDVRLEVIYDSTTPKMLADRIMRMILGELEDFIYALDDTPLEQRIYEGLRLRNAKLSVCESFTGGNISARLVTVSGISEFFTEGVTSYSNQSKIDRLFVKADTLQRYGAVSAQTAHEMAEGLFSADSCNVCVATTGIAGPKSDNTKKPVGLCYIAAGIDGQIFVNEYVFQGDRKRITQTAVNYALFAIFKLLKQ